MSRHTLPKTKITFSFAHPFGLNWIFENLHPRKLTSPLKNSGKGKWSFPFLWVFAENSLGGYVGWVFVSKQVINASPKDSIGWQPKGEISENLVNWFCLDDVPPVALDDRHRCWWWSWWRNTITIGWSKLSAIIHGSGKLTYFRDIPIFEWTTSVGGRLAKNHQMIALCPGEMTSHLWVLVWIPP